MSRVSVVSSDNVDMFLTPDAETRPLEGGVRFKTPAGYLEGSVKNGIPVSKVGVEGRYGNLDFTDNAYGVEGLAKLAARANINLTDNLTISPYVDAVQYEKYVPTVTKGLVAEYANKAHSLRGDLRDSGNGPEGNLQYRYRF